VKANKGLVLVVVLVLWSENCIAHAQTVSDQEEEVKLGSQRLPIVLPSPAIFLGVATLALLFYSIFCCWLSIGWLHFAKAVVVAKRTRDQPVLDLEAQGSNPRVFPNEQNGSRTRHTLLREAVFKANVLHDALITYSSVLDPAAIRSMFCSSLGPAEESFEEVHHHHKECA